MRIGVYDVVGRVAGGQTNAVWKGHDAALDRDVALKKLDVADPTLLSGFSDEATLLASLEHPNIIRLYDFVQQDDEFWLALEWIDGATFAQVAALARRLTIPQSLGVVRGALVGLAYAHERDIVHGDVAPDNILIDKLGESKLIDFGLARRVGEPGTGGTPGYASPEAMAGGDLTPASDVYSMAAVLSRTLDGSHRTPLIGSAEVSLKRVPPEVRSVLEQALDENPSRRQPNAQELLDAFAGAAERAYGPGWWTTAGVGAVVTAATPVALATLGVGLGGAAGVTAAGEAVAGGSGLGVVAAGIAQLGTKTTALILSGTLVVATVTGVLLLRRGSDEPRAQQIASQAPSVPPSSTPPAASTPPEDPLLAFTGTYRYVSTVVSSNFAGEPVGSKQKSTWYVSTTCKGSCTSYVTDSAGETLKLTQKGSVLRDSDSTPASCVRSDTGKKIKSIPARFSREIKMGRTINGRVSEMAGEGHYRTLGPCGGHAHLKINYKITVTRVS